MDRGELGHRPAQSKLLHRSLRLGAEIFSRRAAAQHQYLLQDKAMFGSDWPAIGVERWLEEFGQVNMKPEIRKKIMLDNAVKFFGITPVRRLGLTTKTRRARSSEHSNPNPLCPSCLRGEKLISQSTAANHNMDGIKFVDTTIRDGHQSLWAESMTTGMMLPVAEAMDRAGFDAIELISSSHLKKCVRELKEDPWARVKLVSQRIKNTPLRLNAGRFSAFDITPRSMYRLFMERMAANGIREARISEEWNELEGWEWKTKVSRDVGINPVLNIIYSVSPKHTDEYFAERTRQAASLKVNRLCLKDPGGLLTPERVQTLVPIVFANASGIPVELHTHCTTGLGPLCCLEAVKLGIKNRQHGAAAAGGRLVQSVVVQCRQEPARSGVSNHSSMKICSSRYPSILPTSPNVKAFPLARRWSTTTRSTSTKCPAA